uniref:Uncharacterized protein n=1 Tax=Cucumis melo TaxID=3656 RepID=A0A9I9DAB3_CUCME
MARNLEEMSSSGSGHPPRTQTLGEDNKTPNSTIAVIHQRDAFDTHKAKIHIIVRITKLQRTSKMVGTRKTGVDFK